MPSQTAKATATVFAATIVAAYSACVGGTPRRGGTPFEEMTLQNLLKWPSGQDYLEGIGTGRPPEEEKDAELRRKAAREAAAIEAQQKLIDQLLKLVPRPRVREILRRAEVARIDYGYDDACTLTLRIPKEAVTGPPPIE